MSSLVPCRAPRRTWATNQEIPERRETVVPSRPVAPPRVCFTGPAFASESTDSRLKSVGRNCAEECFSGGLQLLRNNPADRLVV